MTQSIFAGLDWGLVIYAALMAAVMSTMMTLRARNAQRAAGQTLTPWTTLIPDTVVGMITGTALALGVPDLVPRLGSISGITLLAGAGGVLGPQVWDLVVRDGRGLLVRWLAGLVKSPTVTQWAEQHTATPPTTGGEHVNTQVQPDPAAVPGPQP
ncbi:hypothetical protein [Deinococcus arenicola]|uniref:Uncharacterized protein n=1 Tax=Deinococcus arenicola TaxID=2994950 RepID=A0ABU4DV95_9DEIO|nr:hypothetical protein [Deinococcus sp. ZS9-10]MDV6376356.1 hypothetical protein [Deinococcus sp. ZS9-10]